MLTRIYAIRCIQVTIGEDSTRKKKVMERGTSFVISHNPIDVLEYLGHLLHCALVGVH